MIENKIKCPAVRDSHGILTHYPDRLIELAQGLKQFVPSVLDITLNKTVQALKLRGVASQHVNQIWRKNAANEIVAAICKYNPTLLSHMDCLEPLRLLSNASVCFKGLSFGEPIEIDGETPIEWIPKEWHAIISEFGIVGQIGTEAGDLLEIIDKIPVGTSNIKSINLQKRLSNMLPPSSFIDSSRSNVRCKGEAYARIVLFGLMVNWALFKQGKDHYVSLVKENKDGDIIMRNMKHLSMEYDDVISSSLIELKLRE